MVSHLSTPLLVRVACWENFWKIGGEKLKCSLERLHMLTSSTWSQVPSFTSRMLAHSWLKCGHRTKVFDFFSEGDRMDFFHRKTESSGKKCFFSQKLIWWFLTCFWEVFEDLSAESGPAFSTERLNSAKLSFTSVTTVLTFRNQWGHSETHV